jgi:hypothetical protein
MANSRQILTADWEITFKIKMLDFKDTYSLEKSLIYDDL